MLQRYKTRFKYGSGLAEFLPALFVFLFVIALPLINLLTFCMGYANVSMLGTQCAVDAANANSFPDVLSKVQSRANSIVTSPMGRFAKMVPIGGYLGCGVNVFTVETDITTNVVKEYGPNTKITAPFDPNNKIYEYVVRTNFNIGPFMSLGAIPWIGGIPMIGVPTPVSTAAHRAVEHTEAISLFPANQSSLLAISRLSLPLTWL